MSTASKVQATIRLNTMFCQKRNDGFIVGPIDVNPHDEIYALVGGAKSDGTLYHKILPSDETRPDENRFTQWDFTDHESDEQYLDPRYTRPGGTPNNASESI